MKKTHWAERFWDKVNKSAGCWEWTGGTNGYGYGVLAIAHGRPRLAHRLSWELAHGPVPDGLCVLHRCDNRLCIRPDHLFIGTRSENTKDRHDKGRTARGESFTPSKLTAAQAADIRARYAAIPRYARGRMRPLLREFGIAQSTLYSIVNEQTWRRP